MGSLYRRRSLLASSSLATLLIGVGVPSAWAACTQIHAATDNPAGTTVAGFCVTNTSFSGSITNEGTISPSGVTFTNGTITGGITSTGTISGGISLDKTSKIAATGTAITIGGTGFSGGISNAGTISGTSGPAIVVGSALGFTTLTSFSGNISNSGIISSANNVAIDISAVSKFSGNIINTGTISAPTAFLGTGIAIGEVTSFAGSISNSGTISAGNIGINIGSVTVLTGGISNNGVISAAQEGIGINGVSTFLGGISNSGTISSATAGGISVGAGTFAGGVNNSGTILAGGASAIAVVSATSFSGGISNSGTISSASNGIVALFNTNFSNGISNSGTISAGGSAILIETITNLSGGISNSGKMTATGDGIVLFGISTFSGNVSNSGTITAAKGILVSSGVSFAPGSAIVNSGTIIGTTAAIDTSFATRPVTIDQTGGLISGAIKLSTNADVVNISGGTIAGNIVGAGSADTINFTLGSGAFTYGNAYSFTGINQVNVASGTVILDGANSAAHVTVAGGTLEIGDAANTGAVLTVTGAAPVDVSGTLAGHGTLVGNVMVESGGTLAPGGSIGTLTINGNLTFGAGSFYTVGISSPQNSKTQVNGTATLGGATVNAVFGTGSSIVKTSTILTATGGVSGTFAPNVTTNFAAVQGSLSYDAHDANLNFTLNYNAIGGLSGNQQAVGNALNNAFNASGSLPAIFASLTPGGLTQVSGETATGSQQTTFDAMNLFMGVMTDPFVSGRGDSGPAGAGAPLGYASVQNAYAMFTKAPPVTPFEQRWSVWAAGFGGSQTTDGNATVGSNTSTSNVYGTAVGADYRISPFTVAGFALAGGGTNFSVAGSGSGHSDLFQAGAFIRHTVGPAYISAALAYGWQDITTNRTVTAAGSSQLRAQFDANAFSGRLEGGYRFVAPWVGGVGITPYAAAQFTTFDLPAYAEQALVGSNAFALAYGAKDVTDTRSELGIRTDKSWAMTDGILTLRGRVAWAHDYDPDRAIAATFQALPGASFVVNGAAQAADSALVTASIEKKWLNGWSAAATFEGEFSDVTRSYAGKGVVRYQW
jgi:uncharacterized protein with beta-barrel porin domain